MRYPAVRVSKSHSGDLLDPFRAGGGGRAQYRIEAVVILTLSTACSAVLLNSPSGSSHPTGVLDNVPDVDFPLGNGMPRRVVTLRTGEIHPKITSLSIITRGCGINTSRISQGWLRSRSRDLGRFPSV